MSNNNNNSNLPSLSLNTASNTEWAIEQQVLSPQFDDNGDNEAADGVHSSSSVHHSIQPTADVQSGAGGTGGRGVTVVIAQNNAPTGAHTPVHAHITNHARADDSNTNRAVASSSSSSSTSSSSYSSSPQRERRQTVQFNMAVSGGGCALSRVQAIKRWLTETGNKHFVMDNHGHLLCSACKGALGAHTGDMRESRHQPTRAELAEQQERDNAMQAKAALRASRHAQIVEQQQQEFARIAVNNNQNKQSSNSNAAPSAVVTTAVVSTSTRHVQVTEETVSTAEWRQRCEAARQREEQKQNQNQSNNNHQNQSQIQHQYNDVDDEVEEKKDTEGRIVLHSSSSNQQQATQHDQQHEQRNATGEHTHEQREEDSEMNMNSSHQSKSVHETAQPSKETMQAEETELLRQQVEQLQFQNKQLKKRTKQ